MLALSEFNPILASIQIIFWKLSCKQYKVANDRHHIHNKHMKKVKFSYSLIAKTKMPLSQYEILSKINTFLVNHCKVYAYLVHVYIPLKKSGKNEPVAKYIGLYI